MNQEILQIRRKVRRGAYLALFGAVFYGVGGGIWGYYALLDGNEVRYTQAAIVMAGAFGLLLLGVDSLRTLRKREESRP